MSSSVFKVYPSSSCPEDDSLNDDAEEEGGASLGATTVDEHLKIDSNLVIVVGKDGSVHVDQKTLHSLLANETNDTSVSLVRITSPTPSIEEEIEEERRLLEKEKQRELDLNAEDNGEGSEDSPESSNGGSSTKSDNPTGSGNPGPSGVSTRRNKSTAKKDDVMLDDEDVPHVSLLVEGYYPPEEAKKFAAEVLSLAGLQKPLQVTTAVDHEFQKYVVANDHCYTPLTSPSQKLPPRSYYDDPDTPEIVSVEGTSSSNDPNIVQMIEDSGSTNRKKPISKTPVSSPTSKTRRRKSIAAKAEYTDAEDLQSILEDTDSEFTDESSPDEDDNENDLDFSISGKQTKKRVSGSRNRTTSRSTSKKDDLVETKDAKKKVVKTPKKSLDSKMNLFTVINKSGVPKTYGSKKDTIKNVETPPLPSSPAPVANPIPISVIVPVVKKEKKVVKPAPHVEALFSDMTTLFSTPDIIKKVGTTRPTVQVNTPTVIPTIVPSTSTAVRGFVQLSPACVKGAQKLPAHISIQTHTSASEEHDKRLDYMDSIVQQELSQPKLVVPESLQPPPQLNIADDIAKMLESNLNPGGVQEPVLPIPGNSILAALSSNDDGLPDDLLQHVAELAEHKELQEILDKQVLGVMGPDSVMPTPVATAVGSSFLSSSSVVPITTHQAQPIVQPQSEGHPSALLQKSSEALPTMTVKEQLMPRKESIQIRRSDGRIITLPPIEAPATRSAKRRAQAGGTSSTVTSNVTLTIATAASHMTSSSISSNASSISSSSGTANSAKTSKQSSRVATGVNSYDDGTGGLLIDESRGKGNRSAASSRRGSESSSTSAGRSKRQSTAATPVVVTVDDDVESDESWNSEDDPDRLWCICKQPHNNRFMICCDACEDWFHGKCVNITKAMGQQMEEDGIEWTCPNCLKKKQEKQQPKMTEFLMSGNVSGIGGTSIEAAPKMTHAMVSKIVTVTGCVVCGKPARASSVYCSDDCIRKHAGLANIPVITQANSPVVLSQAVISSGGSLVIRQSAKGRVDNSQMSDTSTMGKANSKTGPIIVMERKTGRCLTGKNAPTAENLRAWLLSHPTFEIVPPGSPQAAIILAKQAEVRRQQLVKEAQKKTTAPNLPASTDGNQSSPVQPIAKVVVQSQLKFSDQRKLTLNTSTVQQKIQQQQAPQKSMPKIVQKSVVPGLPMSRASPVATVTSVASKLAVTTPKPAHTATSSSAISPANSNISKQQKKVAPETKNPVKTPTVAAGENIRVTVKKTLKEHLIQRKSETNDEQTGRLNEQEIEKFAEEIEEELFALFNKDTGAKYRAKYRSLVFNIKDRKNLSLFQKICEKRIEAKQLVRMTAEELASQELAQWREKENKHQLEMIKKSELDLLACAKNYVLKTHKGEEVIEGKSDDRVLLDPTTSVEDVVAVLNNSTVSSTSEVDNTLSPPSKDSYRSSKEYDFSYGKYPSSGLYGSGSITSSSSLLATASSAAATSATSTTSSSTAVKKKETSGSRSRSRSRDRRHDDRSRSRSKHKRRRSKSHDRSRERERDRHRDGSRERDRDRQERDRHRDGSRDRDRDRHRDHKKHESKDSKEKERDQKSAVDKVKAKEASSSVSLEKDKNEALGKLVEAKKQPKKVVSSRLQPLESFNLVDQILASAGSSGTTGNDSTERVDKIMSEESIKPVRSDSISAEQDQEPTSTVTIPTPPHSTSFENESPTTDFPSSSLSSDVSEETRKKAMFVHWTGNVHMIDVASVEMSIRAVSGDVEDIAKDFTEDLDICGTIKPEIVWDYIAQIKKSPSKQICLVRFHSNESAAYYTLYSHLFSRKRYSVVKSPSSSVKDFYIFPLPSEQMIPMILKPLNGVGIIEGDKKPDLLLGIIVKIKGKRSGHSIGTASTASKTPRRVLKTGATSGSPSAVSPSFALMQQVITKYATANKKSNETEQDSTVKASPPDSPLAVTTPKPQSSGTSATSTPTVSGAIQKSRTASESPEQVDVDMEIIKAPIVTKVTTPAKESVSAAVVIDDDDEPYSPGGASDDSDNFADVTAIVENKSSQISILDNETERIRLEMEEINRKIAEEKNEIVGLINKAELKDDEIKSKLPSSLITDISIPSNLSEILASIKSAPPTVSETVKASTDKESTSDSVRAPEDEEEYVPTAPSIYSSFKSNFGYGTRNSSSQPPKSSDSSGSRLAKLSDAELLSMVPDNSYLQSPPVPAKAANEDSDSNDSAPPMKKSRWSSSEPPPPGLEEEFDGE
ncbi:death-inducer obliterator 1-like [Toxorhynchites rutilus septentrionalis]|uniref:death-inducer obliterator 1-like n=1 Tax=Toxorhynchites rutilus septentrionalis TaxID=329112 RepID=UPI00247AA719|nr:death-inducer obliterator 1-like [Toxorhynchites rutilus septentrionalis]